MMVQQIVGINEMILEIMKQYNRPTTFRDIMVRLPSSVGANDIWYALKSLQERMIIESVRLSNKRNAWQIQLWVRQVREV